MQITKNNYIHINLYCTNITLCAEQYILMAPDLKGLQSVRGIVEFGSREDLRLYPNIKQNARHLKNISKHLTRKPAFRIEQHSRAWNFTHNGVSNKQPYPPDKIRLDSRVGKEMMLQYTQNRFFKGKLSNENIREKFPSTRDHVYPPGLGGNKFKLARDLTKQSNYGSTLTLDYFAGGHDSMSMPPPPTPEPLVDIGRIGDNESLPSVITLPTSQHVKNMDPTSDIVKHIQDVQEQRETTPMLENNKKYMYVFPNRKWAKLHDRSTTTPGELLKKEKT